MTAPTDEAFMAAGLRDDAVALGRIMNAARHRRLNPDDLTELLGIARTMVLAALVLDRHIDGDLPENLRHATIHVQFADLSPNRVIRKWSEMPFDGAISYTATSAGQLAQSNPWGETP